MSIFEDLTDYCLGGAMPAANPAKNVGWLGSGSRFETAVPNQDLTRALWEHCLISIQCTRGVHVCHLCNSTNVNEVERDGKRILLGAAEIRILSRAGAVYASPNLIYHYVSTHEYKPPDEFVDAALNGIPPTTDQYFKSLTALGLSWRPTAILHEPVKRVRFVRTPNGVERIEE